MPSRIDQLWSFIHPTRRDEESPRKAEAFVQTLRQSGDELAAGYCSAFLCYFGHGSKALMRTTFELLETVIERDADPMHQVVAHTILANLLVQSWAPGGDSERRAVLAVPHQEAAARLFVERFGEDVGREAFLVYGARVEWNLEGKWKLRISDRDIEPRSWSMGGELVLPLPGAFQHLVAVGDYEGAIRIADNVPTAVRHPRIKGWAAVCRGHLDQSYAADHFALAANHFRTCPWPKHESRLWTSFEKETLAPFYTARAAIAGTRASSAADWEEVLLKVRALLPPDDFARTYPPAFRFALVVGGFVKFLETRMRGPLDELVCEYQREIDRWGTHERDAAVPAALAKIRDGIVNFIEDPRLALARGEIREGIAAIESLPARQPSRFLSGMAGAFAEVALEMAQGTSHREILRLLTDIRDERVLHGLVRELARAAMSPHAKIIHGPVEYGKDVVSIEVCDGVETLKYYAIKAGDITMKNWPSLKESLEQAFSVPSQDAVLSQHSDLPLLVVALFNGHINAFADPVVNAWSAEQSGRGRCVEFCGIDELAARVRARGVVDYLRASVLSK